MATPTSKSKTPPQPKTLTEIVIDALEDIKARDIQLVNVMKITSVFDYIAIASADSTRQTKALVLANWSLPLPRWEGLGEGAIHP